MTATIQHLLASPIYLWAALWILAAGLSLVDYSLTHKWTAAKFLFIGLGVMTLAELIHHSL